MSNFKVFSIISFVVSVCGCSPININVPKQSLGDIQHIEKLYLQRDPLMGLALSGGGTRSASFNIGLMNGLQDGNKLNEFDYISSVSGGSYAALWLFSKLYLNSTGVSSGDQQSFFFKKCYNAQANINNDLECSSDSIFYNDFVPHKIEGFNDCYEPDVRNYTNGVYEDIFHYRFQRHLTNNSVLLRDASQFSNEILNYLYNSVTIGKVFFGGVIPKFILGWTPIDQIFHTNLTFAPYMYQASVERNYGLYPSPDNIKGLLGEGYENQKETILSRQMDNLSFSQLAELGNKKSKTNSPIWLVNATVDVNNSLFRWTNAFSNTPPMHEAVFEFSPLYYGNDSLGYVPSSEYTGTISKAVQMSGAAMDSANPHNSWYLSLPLSLLSIGDYANYGNQHVYLTDGGHSDNFGAYSLIKRRLPIIVISDAEHTSDGVPEALIRLREQLANESVKMKFVLYDEEHRPVRYYLQNDPQAKMLLGHHDYNLNNPLPSVLIGEICETSDINTSEICDDSDKHVSTLFYVKARAVSKFYLNGKNADSGKKGGAGCEIKASSYGHLMESDKEVECYPRVVRQYMAISSCEENGYCYTEQFPGTSTTDIFYEANQFDAYSTFGRHIGHLLADKIRKSCGSDTSCVKPKF
ncbi:hypothetical protein ACH5Y9_01115 [Methylomonas sp. BW4-1]|uniref:hypothetical protein n=1 Tax=Methylomonas sp. BW4-1 TaxID=3376685 RepID=UPI00404312FD